MATSGTVLPHELSQLSAAGGLEDVAAEQLPEWGSGEPDWLVQVTGGCGPAESATAGTLAAATHQAINNSSVCAMKANSASTLRPAAANVQGPPAPGSQQSSGGQPHAQQLQRTSTAGTSSSSTSSGSNGGITSGSSSSVIASSTPGFSHLGLAALARQDEMLRWGSAAVDSMAASARSSVISSQQPQMEAAEETAGSSYQPLTLLDGALGPDPSSSSCLKQVPALDLSKLKPGSNAPGIYSRNMSMSAALQQPSRREVTMCLDTGPAAPVAAGAPINDNRCYIYGAVSGQDLASLTDLLSRLGSRQDAAAVQGLWDALLVARRDAEAVAARGARIVRDVSRDWQETVTDLIDRIVAQDGEIATLKAQMSTLNASSNGRGGTSSGSLEPAMEELAVQVGRLKKQRDKAVREATELAAGLDAARSAAAAARSAATAAQEELNLVCHKHQQLQQQHDIGNKYARQLRSYVSALEEQLTALTSTAAAAPTPAGPTGGLFPSGAATAAGTIGSSDRLSAASVAAAAAAAINGGYLAAPSSYHHHHLMSAGSPLQRRSSPVGGSPRSGQLPRSSPRAGGSFAPAAGSASKLGAAGSRDRSSKGEGGRPDTPNRADRAGSASHMSAGPVRSNTYEFDRCDQIDQEPGPGMAPANVHKFTRMQQQRPSTPDYLAGPPT